MKKLLSVKLLLLGFISFGANAQSDYAANWKITGLFIDGLFETGLQLDLNLTRRFLAVTGALESSDGLESPATGSCFFTSSNGIFCNLQIDHFSYTVALDKNLNGTITAKNAIGAQVDAGIISFLGIN